MSTKCTGCGGKAVKSGNYFITAKNFSGQTVLLGAANIGMCRSCISKCLTSIMWKPVFGFVFSLIGVVLSVTMIAFLKGFGSTVQYVILGLLTALLVGSSVMTLLRFIHIIKCIKHTDKYVKEMTPADIAAVGAKLVLRGRKLANGTIFSWNKLRACRQIIDEEGITDEVRAKITEPMEINPRRQLSLHSFHRNQLHIPYTNIPNTMDKDTRVLIAEALDIGLKNK